MGVLRRWVIARKGSSMAAIRLALSFGEQVRSSASAGSFSKWK
jgi:hypothetical protein